MPLPASRPFAAPICLAFALVMVRLRLSPRFEELLWSSSQGSGWMSVALALFTVYGFVVVFVLEASALRGRAGEQLRARGQDPERFMAGTGAVMFTSPLSISLLASWFGLPFEQFRVYAALSIAGLVFWHWRYRKVILASLPWRRQARHQQ